MKANTKKMLLIGGVVVLLLIVVVMFSLKLKETFADATTVSTIDTLQNGGTLSPGSKLTKCNQAGDICYDIKFNDYGDFYMAKHGDSSGKYIFENPARTQTGHVLTLERTNNLVIKHSSGKIVWQTKTSGKGFGKAKLVLSSDGKLALVDEKKQVLWSFNY